MLSPKWSVSIHASAWEATGAVVCSPDAALCFNPRLRVGGDRCSLLIFILSAGFNPRLRVGGDRINNRWHMLFFVSIHASAWEATHLGGGDDGVRSVSIHASAWEATHAQGLTVRQIARFNPRLRVGGDFSNVGRIVTPYLFQSTPPRGRRRCRGGIGKEWLGFNPRLRVGGDGSHPVAAPQKNGFQSTPPRGRRRSWPWPLPKGAGVSIHASAWEATQVREEYQGLATFQSTPPRGRRPRSPRSASRLSNVSIHASAWEATPESVSGQSIQRVSIHASAWEATNRITVGIFLLFLFQSTPPRGRRPGVIEAFFKIFKSFNPRLRVGGDTVPVVSADDMSVSIHASAWEATANVQPGGGHRHVSIHASAWEATTCRRSSAWPWWVSIHASAWEATSQASIPLPQARCFNPRLRVGGDCIVPIFSYRGHCFNPRLRVGGDAHGNAPVERHFVSIHASAWEATPSNCATGS